MKKKPEANVRKDLFHPDLLRGKTAILTGGGTGLGKAMALQFAALGANVVIASRKLEILKKTAQEIEATGAHALAVGCDVRKSRDIEELKEKTLGRFGRIDILVNNAAGNFICPTENLSENGFKTIVDIVLNGTFLCTHILGKPMMEQEGGTILNIVATYCWTGSGYVVPSVCAKAGVLALTRSLAVEWAKYNLRVNAIAPGVFETEGAFSRLSPPGTKAFTKKRIPTGRFGRPEELAGLAAFLVSDAAQFINGEVVVMDGGEWLKGAGQFNMLDRLPKIAWRALRAMQT